MFIVRLLKGEAKLWQAWWLFSHFAFIILWVCFLLVPKNNATLILMLIFIGAVLAVLSPLVIWRCSSNCKSRGWTSVARILLVLYPLLLMIREVGTEKSPSNLLLISLVFSICIVLIYLTAKLTKSKIMTYYSDKYFIPTLLIISSIFIYASNFI